MVIVSQFETVRRLGNRILVNWCFSFVFIELEGITVKIAISKDSEYTLSCGIPEATKISLLH